MYYQKDKHISMLAFRSNDDVQQDRLHPKRRELNQNQILYLQSFY